MAANDSVFRDYYREEVLRQIPLFVYLVLISVLGTIGNFLVFIVYRRHYPSSNCRTFVLVLSLVDLFSCVLVVPFEVLVVARQFDFQHAIICQISVFLTTFPTLVSGFLLVSIAVDRYRKVCRPFHWQISHTATKRICVFNFLLATVFAVLAPIVYGIKRSVVSVNSVDITISVCTETREMSGSSWSWFNNISYVVLFVGALIVVSVLYCCIAISVKRHEKRQKREVNRGAESTTMITIVNNKIDVTTNDRINNDEILMNKGNRKCSNDVIFLSDSTDGNGGKVINIEKLPMPWIDDEDAKDDYDDEQMRTLSYKTSPDASRDKRNRQNNRRVLRTSYIMFLITLAFILSYLPLLTLLVLRTAIVGFADSLSPAERAVYKFFLRSYFLNCAINPVIYGMWDSKFRKHCKRLF